MMPARRRATSSKPAREGRNRPPAQVIQVSPLPSVGNRWGLRMAHVASVNYASCQSEWIFTHPREPASSSRGNLARASRTDACPAAFV